MTEPLTQGQVEELHEEEIVKVMDAVQHGLAGAYADKLLTIGQMALSSLRQAEPPECWLFSNSEGDDDYMNNRTALEGKHYKGGPVIPLYRVRPTAAPAGWRDIESARGEGMREPRVNFSRKVEAAIEEGFKLNHDAWRLLDLIVAEWKSDPMSVQCFDLRLVEEATRAVARRKEIDKLEPFGGMFQ